MLRGWLGVFALVGCIACSSPTQLLVVIDTDLEPGVEVGAIDVSVSSPGGPSERRTFPLDTTELPFSLGVRPSERDDEAVVVHVGAFAPSGEQVVAFEAATRFVPGEVRVLSIPLARACIAEPPCDDQGLTCLRGECVPVETDSSSLPRRAGDEPQPLFEGPRVAPDAGPPDGGPACIAGEACDTGDPCQVGLRACDPSRCEVASTLAIGTDCGGGRVCNAEGRCGF